MTERKTLHEWAETLRADVEELAFIAFDSIETTARVIAIAESALRHVSLLPQPDPQNPQWRRIALVVQMLVSSIEFHDNPASTSSAFHRLLRFLRENDDLLEFARAG